MKLICRELAADRHLRGRGREIRAAVRDRVRDAGRHDREKRRGRAPECGAEEGNRLTRFGGAGRCAAASIRLEPAIASRPALSSTTPAMYLLLKVKKPGAAATSETFAAALDPAAFDTTRSTGPNVPSSGASALICVALTKLIGAGLPLMETVTPASVVG